jgi:hypothetical protein
MGAICRSYDKNMYSATCMRPLEVCFKEHRCNLMQSILEKSELPKSAYKEGHQIRWKGHNTYSNYNESADMSLTSSSTHSKKLGYLLPSGLPLLNMKLQVTAPSCLRINGNVPALCFIQ